MAMEMDCSELKDENVNCETSDEKLETHTLVSGYSENQIRRFSRKFIILLFLVIILFIISVVLIVLSKVRQNSCKRKTSKVANTSTKVCDYSEEAKRVKFGEFMKKILNEYYNVFPERITWQHDADDETIKARFKIQTFKAETLKTITLKARQLIQEARDMKPNLLKLTPREHKAYLQLVHFLRYTFGNPIFNFTTGLWLLGPTDFCMDPVCYIGYLVNNALDSVTPKNAADVGLVYSHLKDFKVYVYSFIDVFKMGVRKGMVRTQTECRQGIDKVKSRHKHIAKHGASGIAMQWYAKKIYASSYYIHIPDDLNEKYLKTEGKTVREYLKSAMDLFVGQSVDHLIRYLDEEYYFHCRPDDVGPGGLSALPLDVIYYNGSIVNGSTTDPYLPLCDKSKSSCRLNGSEAYAAILGYFTTKDIHPDSVHQLGWENLNKLYPQMIEIAKKVTNKTNQSLAVKEFQNILGNLSINFFRDKPLPLNETKGIAFERCRDEESAKKYCPTRWAAMMKWFEFARMTMSMIDPKTVNFFYFSGNRHTTPNCPIELKADFSPSSGAQSYTGSGSSCFYPSRYYIPFFLENLGPKYLEYSVNSHEARPGHHTQIQGNAENFRDKCGVERWLDRQTRATAFEEGWALYAENPLMAEGTDMYKNNLMQKFGMLKGQMWRALRLIIDTGIHYKKMSRSDALKLFKRYAWDQSDKTVKELVRYQSYYGQATAYMIGQMDIWALRNETKEKLGKLYDIKEFHYQVLSQGSPLLSYLGNHVKKYISCKKNTNQQYCDLVLNPEHVSEDKTENARNSRMKWPVQKRYYY